jgi:hypothetical protein
MSLIEPALFLAFDHNSKAGRRQVRIYLLTLFLVLCVSCLNPKKAKISYCEMTLGRPGHDASLLILGSVPE